VTAAIQAAMRCSWHHTVRAAEQQPPESIEIVATHVVGAGELAIVERRFSSWTTVATARDSRKPAPIR